MDYINIGSTPAEETCSPCGHHLSRKETEIYKQQLQREFPAGKFTIKGFPHDFGTYYEVVAWFGDSLPADTSEAAFNAESEASGKWDALSLEALQVLRAL